MGGSGHSQRQPATVRSLAQRSLASLLDSRRQTEADIRPAIYVRPLDPRYHIVKNACNDQPYVVGSAVGRRTFTPGQVVFLGSHAGHPGEVIIGLPPPGFGGASAFAIVRDRRGFQTDGLEDAPPGTGVAYRVPQDHAWDPTTSEAIVDREKLTYLIDDAGNPIDDSGVVRHELVRIPSAKLPHSDVLTVVGSFALIEENAVAGAVNPSSWGSSIVVACIKVDPSTGNVYVWYTKIEAGTIANTNIYYLALFDRLGTLQTRIEFDGTQWAANDKIEAVFLGGYLFAIEPRDENISLSGPPFAPWFRVTKRSLTTLAQVAEWNMPTPATGRGDWPYGLVPIGAGLHFLYLHQIAVPDWYDYYRTLSAALSPGAETRLYYTLGAGSDFPDDGPASIGNTAVRSGSQLTKSFISPLDYGTVDEHQAFFNFRTSGNGIFDGDVLSWDDLPAAVTQITGRMVMMGSTLLILADPGTAQSYITFQILSNGTVVMP